MLIYERRLERLAAVSGLRLLIQEKGKRKRVESSQRGRQQLNVGNASENSQFAELAIQVLTVQVAG